MHKLLPFAFWTVCTTTMAVSHTFTYRVENLPLADTVSCHATAKELLKKFSSPDVSYPRAVCAAFANGLGTIEIEYEAEKAVNVASTYQRSMIFSQMRYHSLAECQNKLEDQVALFEQETQLETLVAYCFPSRLSSQKGSYMPRIEAIGSPTKAPFSAGYYFFMNPVGGSYAGLRSALHQRLAAQNGALADLVIGSSIGSRTASIHYFAKDKLTFEHLEIASYRTEQDCRTETAEVSAGLSQTSNPPVQVYCGNAGSGRYEIGVVQMGPLTFKWRNSAETFATIAACRAQQGELKKFYESSLGKTALASTCSQFGSQYALRLYWNQ